MPQYKSLYPLACNPEMVGVYPAHVRSGAGHIYTDVLEYRVWCHPEQGAPNEFDGDDYYQFFTNYEDALFFSNNSLGAEPPVVLIRQNYWIVDQSDGQYIAYKGERLTEWQPQWLTPESCIQTEEELEQFYRLQQWPYPEHVKDNFYATPLMPSFNAYEYQKFPNYLGVSVCRCLLEKGLAARHISHVDGYWYVLCDKDLHDLTYADITEQDDIILVAMAELLQYQPDLTFLYDLENNHELDRLSRTDPWVITPWQDDDIYPDSPLIH